MMKENDFEQAAAFLPDRLRQAARQMTEEQKEQCEEFRLRAGQPFAACCGGQIVHLPPQGPSQIVTREDLELLVARCTGRSAHTYARQIAQGYLSLPGGSRGEEKPPCCGSWCGIIPSSTTWPCWTSGARWPLAGTGFPNTTWGLIRT